MLKCTILAVGKLKETWWREAEAEYLRRLGPVMRTEVIAVEAEALGSTVSSAKAMEAEGERLRKRIPQDAYVIALERSGTQASSPDFAAMLDREGGTGRTVVFLIGGSDGLDPTTLARADAKISFSKMTFTHEMARVLLLEQLYRATAILSGKPYHR